MNSKIKSLAFKVTLVIGFALLSCSGNTKFVAYQCHMNCQIDTAYTSEGKCPVCEMDLKGVENTDTSKIKILKNK